MFLFTHVTSVSQIYAGDPVSLSLTNLSSGAYDEAAPRRAEGPGAGRYEGWYLFQSARSSGPADIYLRAYDGTEEIRLTTLGGGSGDWWVGRHVLDVAIDVKPGSDPNCFNINGHGVIPVAILGSETLDVGDIVPESLEFAGLAVRVRGNGAPQCSFEDTDLDGWTDLVCQFSDDPTTWVDGEGTATLRGKLVDGSEIEGTDAICVVP